MSISSEFRQLGTRVVLAGVFVTLLGGACSTSAAEKATSPTGWRDELLSIPYQAPRPPFDPMIELIRQDFETLELRRSVIQTPMKIGDKTFDRGLGTHSVSHIRIHSSIPVVGFSAWVGVDVNERTGGERGSVEFVVSAEGKEHKSPVLKSGQPPHRIELAFPETKILDLHVTDGGDGPGYDHADWADATIKLKDGRSLQLDDIRRGHLITVASSYPFSFTYAGQPSDTHLAAWPQEKKTQQLDADRSKTTIIWTDPATGLRLTWEALQFADYPAAEWMLHLENTGRQDTPIIEDVQALNWTIGAPLRNDLPYLLHKTLGAPSNETDFEYSTAMITPKAPQTLSGGGGRSSNKDLPFFKIDTGRGSLIVAVGWSGQWLSTMRSPEPGVLHITTGLEKTHFLLHPGEKVRSPRMLLLCWEGDSWESNAQFRQLIYKHYVATRSGKKPLPTFFCNTCFTRGGGWLNECNEQNQISLINAYARFGMEVLLTDAGWFEGGWPAGAGNWTPRKDAYPQGMGPVAAAAKAKNMSYGLWFEPERVVAGTDAHRNHPDWCLSAHPGDNRTYLLNFGLPEVQEYFYNIVKGFMDLPGFRVYRQDFNMDPLPYWRFTDKPDRQGMTEMKYIEGLYAYWDRLAQSWPDSFRDECSSGGRRIDLETIMRMHVHQKTDYWFDNEVDQQSIWGLSQYLPNNTITAHLARTDDYSFHSTLASSLCLGWIADAPDFDVHRAGRLLQRYNEVRHLLIGAWYPLLPSSRDQRLWTGFQFHRPDLDEGLLLVFRRAASPYRTVECQLRGLDPQATYELTCDSTGLRSRQSGRNLMDQFQWTIPDRHRSELIVYRKFSP